jgi:broad specificity phosphatase PhoE
MENRYPELDGQETWPDFQARIHSCTDSLNGHGYEQSIAVFTSATPIAIHAGAALGLSNDKLISILGVIYNTSVSVLRLKDDGMRLFTFNSVAHLDIKNRSLR